ncbi:Gfo/Idh/MocA family protein [Pelagicoccus mobilis]|uniref:Gfo/Idh/MocA family oxidoreductase n=1 Tax=Pelagicoccus mobilis TaxID=415221 RepID=A0A934RVV3_9BACT|nr:Gfo/Idh/MocA family oxidoreductase [Pelagicoccus mobilis]MBK1877436.1 Gfo/Idh/MocA family oxidoreductase [Pelagicoccus mobilis]
MNRKLRMGMVGGGIGAFIGNVHRRAAALDGQIELVAGAFSSDPKKSKRSGKELFLDPSRVYGSYLEMAKAEAALPEDQRIDFVTIVTPNSTHFEIASAFLKAGFNVICDKPMTFDLAQAKKLRTLVRRIGKVFALTHNYTGYPMVKEAKEMVKKGKLGRILKIVTEYPQGYAVGDVDNKAVAKIASWRTDPSIAGASNCMGDIGTHAANLGSYITGLEMESLCAELTAFIPGRLLDDDGNVLIRYKGGAKGVLYASQISNGDENNLNIRIYGTKCSLEWHQESPDELIVKYSDKPRQIVRRGNAYNCRVAQENTRLPFGHPEGFIEAFANVYVNAAKAIRAEVSGKKMPKSLDFPTVDDGVKGMAFVETVVKSAKSKSKWTKMAKS